MRDLIAAFETAVKAEATARGWRKRTHVYTLPLDHDFDAWLGLNSATKYHPLKINPVVGLRFAPVQQLLAELLGPVFRMQPTLSRPVGHLMPSNMFLQVTIDSVTRAPTAASEVCDLVDEYGLPFARRHASVTQLLEAIRRREYVISSDWQRILLPAVEYVTGDHTNARTQVMEGIEHHGDNLVFGNVAQYHQFADGLLALLDR